MSRVSDRIANDLIGVAGVHWVAFKLSLRGLIVLPTIRNTAGIDLLVNDPRTGAQAALQVKTSMKRVAFWPTSTYEKCLKGPGSYHVFLRFIEAAQSFEAFLVSGDTVVEQIKRNAEDYRRRGRKAFAYWRLPKSLDRLDALRRDWDTWVPIAMVAPLQNGD
jgi:hypothetical protein